MITIIDARYNPESDLCGQTGIKDIIFLAYDDSPEVIGTCSACLNDGWIYITNLYVKPDYRRSGVASELIESLCFNGRTLFPNAYGLSAGINKMNTASINLFKSFGFRHAWNWKEGENEIFLYTLEKND